jgi:hypothetical protein
MLTITDLEGIYNASAHPDVKMGKKTEWEVLEEFLSTFEQHTSDKDGNVVAKNKKILLKDFVGYYNKISMTIDSDLLFEQTIANAWDDKLKQQNQKAAWSNVQISTRHGENKHVPSVDDSGAPH